MYSSSSNSLSSSSSQSSSSSSSSWMYSSSNSSSSSSSSSQWDTFTPISTFMMNTWREGMYQLPDQHIVYAANPGSLTIAGATNPEYAYNGSLNNGFHGYSTLKDYNDNIWIQDEFEFEFYSTAGFLTIDRVEVFGRINSYNYWGAFPECMPNIVGMYNSVNPSLDHHSAVTTSLNATTGSIFYKFATPMYTDRWTLKFGADNSSDGAIYISNISFGFGI